MFKIDHTQRRRQIFDLLPDNSLLILVSAPKFYRNADTEFPFRQNSHFFYVTGFLESSSMVMLIKKQGQTKSILLCQDKDPNQERWTGKKWGPAEAKIHFAFDDARSYQDAQKVFLEELEGIEQVSFIPGEPIKFEKKLFNWLSKYRELTRNRKPVPNKFIDAREILDELRVFKQHDEIKVIQAACDISVQAHVRAMQLCKPGLFEYQLEAELLHEFYCQGARSPAYTSIVAGGENACILHYIENNCVLKNNELVLIDAGAEFHYYSADITRTFPVNGKFSTPQKDIYETVLQAQLAAIQAAKVGTPWFDLQKVVVENLVEGLLALNILKGDKASIIENREYEKFYMHNCGHWLGSDVHDAGAYHDKGATRQLQNGMFFTIEPGLYFPPEDKSVPKAYRGIGVRIEDDILIEDNVAKVLTAALPKTCVDIEAIMQG